jgi:hypothetical protein
MNLLKRQFDILTIQESIGYEDGKNTMIYTQALNRAPPAPIAIGGSLELSGPALSDMGFLC